ncbi:MAG: T9SS type A sorting domain-containing protein, partial [Saprospiraceae bacterium]
TNPVPITVINGLNGPISGMKVNGTDLYFYEHLNNSISKIDITASSPVVINIDSGYHAGDFEFVGNDMFVSDVENNLILKYTNLLLSTNDNFLPNSISVFPNPSNYYIQLSGLTKPENYLIYSVLGVEVKNGIISNIDRIDIQNLKTGQYYIKLNNGHTLNFIKD